MPLRIASDLIRSMRYKLRMFGVPIKEAVNIFCDNKSVYNNSSFAESQLKKKHQSICFHTIRECAAANILFVHWVELKYNLADILTKALGTEARVFLRKRIMYSNKEENN